MSYTLKELNDAVRSDPKGYAEECDAIFAQKVQNAARNLSLIHISAAPKRKGDANIGSYLVSLALFCWYFSAARGRKSDSNTGPSAAIRR